MRSIRLKSLAMMIIGHGRRQIAIFTAAAAIGALTGLLDAFLIHFAALRSDQVAYVPPRVWIVCPILWIAWCVIGSLPLLVLSRRVTLPWLILLGPGAMALARLVIGARLFNLKSGHIVPIAAWLAIACIAVYFAYRATERWVGFVLRPQVLTIIWVPVFTACCAIPFWASTHRKPATSSKASQPNIVLIFIDTLRQDYSGLDGHPEQAPNLARFAERGTVYANAYSPFSWTLPSHLSVVTGYNGDELGIDFEHQHYGGQRQTLGERLRAAGYYTAGIASNPWLNPASGFSRGVDDFRYSINDLDVCRSGLGFYMKLIPNVRAPICRWTGERLTPAAIDVVRTAPRPYFLTINYMETHLPLWVPRRCRPAGYKPFEPVVEYPLIDRSHRTGIPLPHSRQQHLKEDYAISMRCLDEEMASLFDAIQSQPDGENTVVAVVGDHGEQFGEHGLSLHANSVYRQVLHVPLLLKGPGIDSGRYIEPVSTTWLYSSLLQLAHLSPPRTSTALPRIGSPPPGPSISVHRSPKTSTDIPPRLALDRWSAFFGRYHYVLAANGDQELYDELSDPEETRNLWPAGTAQDVIAALRTRGFQYHERNRSLRIDRGGLFSIGYLQ
jgi:arylsulfatase A-like enzyme